MQDSIWCVFDCSPRGLMLIPLTQQPLYSKKITTVWGSLGRMTFKVFCGSGLGCLFDLIWVIFLGGIFCGICLGPRVCQFSCLFVLGDFVQIFVLQPSLVGLKFEQTSPRLLTGTKAQNTCAIQFSNWHCAMPRVRNSFFF